MYPALISSPTRGDESPLLPVSIMLLRPIPIEPSTSDVPGRARALSPTEYPKPGLNSSLPYGKWRPPLGSIPPDGKLDGPAVEVSENGTTPARRAISASPSCQCIASAARHGIPSSAASGPHMSGFNLFLRQWLLSMRSNAEMSIKKEIEGRSYGKEAIRGLKYSIAGCPLGIHKRCQMSSTQKHGTKLNSHCMGRVLHTVRTASPIDSSSPHPTHFSAPGNSGNEACN